MEQKNKANELKMTFKRIRSNEWIQSNTATVNTPPTTPSLVPPPAKKPRHNGNVPKNSAPHNRPLTPGSKSPSVERSPFNGIGSHLSSPVFPLDGILTPTSISPNEEIEKDPMEQIVHTIVNWDAGKLIDPQYKNAPFHMGMAAVPKTSFENFGNYQKCVPI